MTEEKPKATELRIESIMTSPVETLTLLSTIEEAINLFLQKKISGAPIVDQVQRVLSVISESDLMKFAVIGGLHSKISDHQERLIPTKNLITVQRRDLFADAFKKFMAKPVRRLIVIDATGKLQGIVSRRDILRVFLESRVEPTTT